MFHSILYFLLGFLSAAFLALAAAPTVWRRAVTLTRRRVEASMPMTQNEILAERDRLRADHAMAVRRLEMGIQSAREKAATQAVEIGRNRDEMKRLADELAAAAGRIEELEGEGEAMREEIARRGEELELLSKRLAEADSKLEERQRELDDLGRQHRETSISASNLQIDLVARETAVEKLAGDISILREEKREQAGLVRSMARELREAREQLKAEASHAADLDRRLQRTIATLAEREEKLDQREREIQRMRDHMKKASPAVAAEPAAEAEAPADNTGDGAWTGAPGALPEAVVARLTAERGKLEERLKRMARENRRLREATNGAGAGNASGMEQENAVLRDRISSLAAEVVALTMKIEGDGSGVRNALNGALEGDADREARENGTVPSIADRIRALQHRDSAVQ
ncbi:MAG: hypothetical protein K5872_16195 [Rhizobiaceae bacterium]|nr:hypothetical protein [Rhizobiaceae bacterium]MCV0407764.1 hypothetical protein [Rhizobiaceae bacterium]